MSTDTIPDDPDAKSSIIGRAPTNICSVGGHLEIHLIRITQGSVLGLLGVLARRRDDVGSRPTAAGGLAMYRSYSS